MISPQVRARIEEMLADEGRPAQAWPEIPEALVVFLEDLYPPRCLQHNESVEDHLRYAGAAELVSNLRHHHDMARRIEAALDDGSARPGEHEVEVSF